MADALAVELHALAAETASGSGAAVDIGELRSAAKLHLRVTASTVAAGVSLVVTLETSPDGTTGWRAVASFDPTTSVVRAERVFDELERFIRVSWTMSGGDSFTFSVSGKAHVLLATWQDVITSTLPLQALEELPIETRAKNLLIATEMAYEEIGPAYPPPLTDWSESVRGYTATIAASLMMTFRGVAPEGVDEMIFEQSKAAMSALKRIGRAEIRPAANQPPTNHGPVASSGNPASPDTFPTRFSGNWGDFG